MKQQYQMVAVEQIVNVIVRQQLCYRLLPITSSRFEMNMIRMW